jgi:hypothetical protein
MTAYQIAKVVKTYNRRGAVIKTERETIATITDPVQGLKLRAELDKRSYVANDHSVSYELRNNDRELFFIDVFTIVEGENACNRVLEGEQCLNMDEWIASKG